MGIVSLVALAGCATVRGLAALRDVQFALGSVSGVRLAGIDLEDVASYEDLSPAQTVRCQPNIFGGQDCETPEGRITSQPNVFGGQNYTLPDGRRVTSQPNIFGGQDYRKDQRQTARCQPNVFGGQDCDTPTGRITSQPNVFGGQDYRLPHGGRGASQPNIFGGQDYRGERGEQVVPLLGNPSAPKRQSGK